jgi:heptosyltransferase II
MQRFYLQDKEESIIKKTIFFVLTALFFCLTKFTEICRRPKTKIDARLIKKILVIRRGAIGDVVMTTPLLQEIKKNFVCAKIDFLVEKWSREVVLNHPCVECVHTLDLMTHPIKQLKAEKYDIVFHLDTGIKGAIFSRLLRPKILTGINAFYRGFLFDYKMDRFIGDGVHERDSFLGTLEAMGFKTQVKEALISLTAEEENFAKKFWQENHLSDRIVMGIFPGGGMNPGTFMPLKRWGEEKYAALGLLFIKAGYKMLLFGSANDRPIAESVKNYIQHPDLIDICGKFSLRQIAALIQCCQVFISNDSGLMHISAAVKTPTISIFGPTDPSLLAPYGNKHFAFYATERCSPDYSQIKSIDCHPCYRQLIGDFNDCCKTKECMKKIDPSAVFQKAQEFLTTYGPTPGRAGRLSTWKIADCSRQ